VEAVQEFAGARLAGSSHRGGQVAKARLGQKCSIHRSGLQILTWREDFVHHASKGGQCDALVHILCIAIRGQGTQDCTQHKNVFLEACPSWGRVP
jgi:hypothetical protein